MDTCAKRETNKDKLRVFYDGIVMNVVYHYFEVCLLKDDMCSLPIFLHNHVHHLFHLRNPGILCCQCPESITADNKRKRQLIGDHEFSLLFYNDKTVLICKHEGKSDDKIKKHCICALSAYTKTEICDLDITLIYTIIDTCLEFPPTPGNPRWIQDIKDVRNDLFHSGLAISVEKMKLGFAKLEKATCNLASVISKMYHRDIQQRIEDMKSRYDFKEDVITAVQMCNKDLQNEISKALDRMEHVVGDNLRFRFERPEFHPSSEHTSEEMTGEMTPEGEKKCIVVWTFKTKGKWNVDEVEKKLKQVSVLLDFTIEFVYEGSLIVKSFASMSLLTDTNAFHNAIGPFLEHFAQQCELAEMSDEDEIGVAMDIFYIPIPERDDYKEICKICKEKDEAIHNRDDEIYRLKQEINKQLKRSYSSLMMDMGSLQRSLSKELYIEDPVESLLASLDDIENKYGSDVVSMDTIGATQQKQTFNVDEDLESSKMDMPRNKTDQLDVTLSRNSQASENRLSMLTKLNISASLGELLSINTLALTANDQLVATTSGTNHLLVFSNSGSFLGGCRLIGNTWDVCVCPRKTKIGDGDDVTEVLLSLPDENSYQYANIHVDVEESSIMPSRAVFVGFYCMGINVTTDVVMIGGENLVHVYSRSDEFLQRIRVDCSIIRIALNSSFSRNSSIDVPEDNDFTTVYHLLLLDNSGKIYEESIELLLDETKLHQVTNICLEKNSLKQESINDLTVDMTKNETLILSTSKNSVYSLHLDRTVEKLLTKHDDIVEPTAFCFDENSRKLFIANRNGSEILVFDKSH